MSRSPAWFVKRCRTCRSPVGSVPWPGCSWPWLGVAALVGLTLYFLGAVGFHLRVGDQIAGFGGPLALAGIMAVAAAVRAATI